MLLQFYSNTPQNTIFQTRWDNETIITSYIYFTFQHSGLLSYISYNFILSHNKQGGWTPLVWASYKGHVDVVHELLNYGANPEARGQVSSWTGKSCPKRLMIDQWYKSITFSDLTIRRFFFYYTILCCELTRLYHCKNKFFVFFADSA